jgi:hypothetical protein
VLVLLVLLVLTESRVSLAFPVRWETKAHAAPEGHQALRVQKA